MELLLHFCQKSFECFWLGLILSSVLCSIDLWVYGETMETVTNFIFLDFKITADGDYSHEIKRHLLLGRKVMTNIDSILKSRDITLPTKVHLVKAMFFSSSRVWIWELDLKESWVLKNWYFWTVVLEKALESLFDCKDIKPVNSKAISPDYSLENWCWSWRSNNLATWWEERTHWKRPWCWERLKAGGEGDNRGWDGWMTSPTQWTWAWASSKSGDGQGSLACCSPWGLQSMTEQLNWTELMGLSFSQNLSIWLMYILTLHRVIPPIFFLVKNVLAILGSVFFYVHFRISLPMFTKSLAGILLTIVLNLCINLVRVDIFNMLNIRSMSTVCLSIYLFRSSKISFITNL